MAKKLCPECGGNGQLSLIVPCDKCHGDAEIVDPDGNVVECPYCINGYTRVYVDCERCDGTGYVDA